MMKKLNDFKWLIFLIIATIIPYLVNQTYTIALLTHTLYMGVTLVIAWRAVATLKTVYDAKNEISNKIRIAIYVILVPLVLAMVTAVTLFIWGLVAPFETTGVGDNDNLEPGVTYVVYNEDCAYCNASQANMLRAVNIYNATHFGTKIKTVDVKKRTPVSEKFDVQIDHYGSIVKVDDSGALHEVVYTVGDKDGNPLANSPSNIYERIKKVVNE